MARWWAPKRAAELGRPWTGPRLVYVGCFFNLFLPTSIGGDTARGYYVASEGGSLSVSYSVLLVERLVGLVTLGAVVTGTAGAMIALDTPLPNHFPWPP